MHPGDRGLQNLARAAHWALGRRLVLCRRPLPVYRSCAWLADAYILRWGHALLMTFYGMHKLDTSMHMVQGGVYLQLVVYM